ncbi:hypothetical protein RclHR1_18610002 [Rhizophagus clarus]|uniref:Uncharacterized protein n=1 Tax=Rhizophagus clarus TaxID=94130 RepID=A0A2Z6RFU5_9GLOM|nr:hypothetical protein RclHR1_18610002 [Rhizophagus clarus]GES73114.1 hypothetical protein GLOIN_2v1470631 [Rhizophagus clarus]
MSEVEEVVAIFGVGDYVWVPWSTIINSISIKVKNESENSIKTNKLIKYWPAFVLERHVTTKLRKVAYARIVPTSSPQNVNSLSPKYLVKLIGLNVNQVFYEKSLRSWLSFNPKPLPGIKLSNDPNLSGQDISLSDITIERLTVLYVQAVQKVSNKLKLAFDSRDYNYETSTAEPVKTNSGSPRLKIIYNKSSKDSVDNSSSQTSIYKPTALINVNTPSGSVDFGGRDRDQEKTSDYEIKKTFKLQTNIGSDNSHGIMIKAGPLNDSEKISRKEITNSIIIKKVQGETNVSPCEKPIVLSKEQEFFEKLNPSEFLKKKRGRNPLNNAIVKLDSSTKDLTDQSTTNTTVDSSLLRRTRNGSVFGKWRASKRSRHAQENLEQSDLVLDQNNNDFISNEDVTVQFVSSISTSKTDIVQTKDSTSKNKRKLEISVKKTPVDQLKFSNQVNDVETELQERESKKRKIQNVSAKGDDRVNSIDDKKTMEINAGIRDLDISQPNNSVVECNNTVKLLLKPNVTRMELYKRKNEDLNQTLVEDNYMQRDDVSGMKNERERIINNMNGGNNSLLLVFSSPIQSFRSVLGFGNIFSWNKRSIDT